MHIHILGICGTFMGGIAAIAKQMGFRVSGCDANVYPPMSTQLTQLGIELKSGYLIEHLDDEPDLVIVGNAMARGNVMVEYILDRKIAYTSGPQWLLEHVLKDRWVLAVSGTHGKTTTSSMLTWILQYAGMEPGFLIGGVPQNFDCSARLGNAPFFVIEADEYDTAFFDKRSKFVHYRPNTLVINNMEFDHADIFHDISDIQRQFHHLIRMVPSNGLILSPKNEAAITETLAMGCWTPTEYSVVEADKLLGWHAEKCMADGSEFIVSFKGVIQGRVNWALIGDFNIDNGLMAIAAARHAGVPSKVAIEALTSFINTKRRLELKGEVNQVRVFDDFAHHPTAIAKTLAGVRANVGSRRVIAILEPRSNTMKSGVHKDTLAKSLSDADMVFVYQGEQVKWSVEALIADCVQPCFVSQDIRQLVANIVANAQAGDTLVVMSNGGFGGIHEKLLLALAEL
ncbi:UDP-N-acetylmuramate:L-alanyl-gamma-D-glutamyl-meso-diaminopimelate ligase [Colwellia sp. MB02u-18]|uniref:UDP-N-acetylmuramate:L-alanyl-gamma-D-glutamyl- meso-diaminopimelate ligase n=1 Tax=unclassified Colwellia TaxID=196834 RepID=UPI0015F6E612|nr:MULTISPECIES: UDP-N-acetylmuramate:L-alanyl-gamma-D-glutamyl-meso-diaminopimelate ligase [unclassified Colwellia]MBA6223598.1 UDP-N-acetylmuramate:L-alanyl-gamma-D-glutamyl-meso-diaminopimelate ligase [Colwellia sp. MB3u-45]MBA6267336.1 UDP-N-acetylmuramate:L-alanyl-gamma-D-glutamyl-meso-diaminopimelate ligase [Colwellia sp. MB3u-43]MBA6319779.1 UDP-N-acetylmuramate:L-alanyl-gamma-D-glutamyl-meso-diaminopimelate ligase [Colwellia sp. MB02u-19]MBA6323842.1 UDP-N-acetylmuramate:L-alanyl-gamma-